MTTQEIIKGWVDDGVAKGASHLIVTCDTFDHTDYPVYVANGEDFWKKFYDCADSDKMSRVMEVYDLSGDIEKQLNSKKSWSLPQKVGTM